MTASDVSERLMELVQGDPGEGEKAFPPGAGVRSFQEAGVLTTNQGFVIRLPNGMEFQVSVIRSR
jgi:hypothetical protein